MIPLFQTIDVHEVLDLPIVLRDMTKTLRYSYIDLYDRYEEAVFYASSSTADQHMLDSFRTNPPKPPTCDDVRSYDFTALGNTLFVYGII
jgi:hypothetical protein